MRIEGFFGPDEIAPVVADYERLYGGRKTEQAPDKAQRQARFNEFQFKNIDTLPYAASAATNLISLHPALIDFARALLGVDKVHLYQSHTWAKFTGGANYEQPFHCDFGNHTLTVPSDNVAERTVDFILYLTDVTDAHGALHYVTKPDAEAVLGRNTVNAASDELQAALKAKERSAAGPAGTLLAHGIDTFHRGTNLTAANGHRYTMTVGVQGGRQRRHRFPRLAGNRRTELGAAAGGRHAAAARVSRHSPAGPPVLDRAHPEAHPGAMAGVEHGGLLR